MDVAMVGGSAPPRYTAALENQMAEIDEKHPGKRARDREYGQPRHQDPKRR
jgi:hypothetical protein